MSDFEIDRKGRRIAGPLMAAALAIAALPGAALADAGAYLSARHAAAIDDYSNAAKFYSRALSHSPSDPLLLEQAVLYRLADGDIEGAIPMARRLAEVDDLHRIAHLTLAVDAIADGRFARARERIVETAPDAFNPLIAALLNGWASFGDGDETAAREAFEELQGRALFDIFGGYHRGLLEAAIGNSEGADEAFAKAVGEDLSDASARLAEAYGRFLETEGEPERAVELYNAVLEGTSGDPVLIRALARAEAGEEKPGLLVTTPQQGAAEALFGIAGAFARDDGVRLAMVYTRLALHLHPDLHNATVLLGDLFDARRQYENAAALYEKVPVESPYGRIAQTRRAEALARLDREDAALAALEPLIEAEPQDASLRIARGDLLRRFERWEEAAVAYDAAIDRIDEIESRHWALFYARGIANERAGAWDNAERDLKRALELNPDEPGVLNYLGYSWIEQGQRLEEAREMIETAVAGRPRDGFITDSLGWVLYRLGDFEQAVVYLERAVELQPTDPVINDHLGDALWKVGRRMEARFQWSRAASFDPDEETAARIERKLADGLDVVLAEEEADTRAAEAVDTADDG